MLRKTGLALILLALPAASSAQLSLPPLDPVVSQTGGLLGNTLRPVTDTLRSAADLAQNRIRRMADFVASNRTSVELDLLRQPARRGELLVMDPDAERLGVAAGAGYRLVEQGTIEGLDVPFARLAIPPGRSLAQAQKDLMRLLPGKEVSADQIYFASGEAADGTMNGRGRAAALLPRGGAVGLIDGGVPPGGPLVAQAGFAVGAPRPNPHAQAIRSLLAGAGVERIYAADVYGSDPAGGNALAIARALGWMVRQKVPVVSISLVGPANPLVDRAVVSARAQGTIVVAAVGNDGPSAPPLYPASYPGVIAVTGVDKKGRVLFEAGRALHLDYAAPGADVTALGLDGRRVTLRGTSFAAPLAAARIAANRSRVGGNAEALLHTNREARAAGPRTGRGILCEACRQGS